MKIKKPDFSKLKKSVQSIGKKKTQISLPKLKLPGMSKKKKRLFFSLLALLVAIGTLVLTPVGGVIAAAAVKRDLPIYCVQKDDNVVSLSFDAAWGNEDTQDLIDILGKYKIKATFFVVGQWVDKYPESVLALHEAGHEIMNHSNKHDHFSKLSVEQIIADINACDDKIESITGVRPTLFRPPYGEYNDKVVSTLREMGHYTIQWDVDSLDWKNLTSSDISQRVLSRVGPGSIVLFHNAAKNTPAALPTIIEGLIQKGYCFLPISEIIYRENFTIDHTGRQIPGSNANTAQ